MRKKLFVLLVLAAVFSSFGLAALNVLPHTHGEDFDHSQHSGCVLHQASLISTDTDQAPIALLFVLFAMSLLLVSYQKQFFSHTTSYASSRAPPVLA